MAGGNWSDSWPGTTLEGEDDKVDMKEAYRMMNGVCEDEDEEDRDLNMQGVNVKTPEIYPPQRKKCKIQWATTNPMHEL